MRTNIFEDFGKALSDANPVLWKYLNPGMERKQVEKALTKRKVIGNTGPVIDLFAWRNGTNFLNMNEELYNNSSVFPELQYEFLDLSYMINQFLSLREMAKHHPGVKLSKDRYFPIFWDGSQNYIGVDLQSSVGSICFLNLGDDAWEMTKIPTFEGFIANCVTALREKRGSLLLVANKP